MKTNKRWTKKIKPCVNKEPKPIEWEKAWKPYNAKEQIKREGKRED